MNYGAAMADLRRQLEPVYGTSEAAAIAALVLESTTGVPRGELSVRSDQHLTPEQQARVMACTERLADEEPVQYVLGEAYFYGLRLFVDPAVLIPRPETEELVDWVVRDLRAEHPTLTQKGPLDADRTDLLKILDVGTGSGCIALALKRALPRAEVWGCDRSEAALNVARRNGADLDIRVDFQGCDFLDEAQQKLLPSVDVLVSNPPYIPLRDKATMQGNVLRYEPHGALFVPDEDALLFYRAIARFGHRRLHPGGRLYLEIHEDLGAAVTDLFRAEGYATVELRKDMQGKDRMVRVSR